MLRRTILAFVLLGVLGACQTRSDDDPPVKDTSDCNPRAYETGACGA